MKILLLQPKIGYMDAMRSSPSPPLGLIHAASKLADKYDVQILDARVEADMETKVKQALSDDVVFAGITCHTGPMIHSAIHLSRLIKANSKVPVVWGGTHASLAPELTLNHPDIDICAIGEGEQTSFDLANALEKGQGLEKVPGIAFMQDGQVIKTEPRELMTPDMWPDPPYNLVNMQRYLPEYEGVPSLFFQASRGCPYRCGYCYNAAFNLSRYRKLDPHIALDRLRELKKRLPFKDVYFVDDNFFVDLKWAETIASGLADMGLQWQVQGIDVNALLRMDDDYIVRLKNYGCRRLTIGIETASNRIRKMIHKQGTREDVVRAVSRMKGAGMTVYASFMVGFPTETLAEMRQTVDLALELVTKHDYVRSSPFYNYSPCPNTSGFEAAINDHFVPPKKLEEWALIGDFDSMSWERTVDGRILGKSFFEGLNIATLFIDNKVNDYSSSWIVKLLASIYRPIARFRARKLFFRFMPERLILKKVFNRFTDTH